MPGEISIGISKFACFIADLVNLLTKHPCALLIYEAYFGIIILC